MGYAIMYNEFTTGGEIEENRYNDLNTFLSILRSPLMKRKERLTICWICQNIGNSREHIVKASIFRRHFPDVSQKKPAYKNNDKTKNIQINTSKSKELTFNSLICMKCNNALSQPYDNAWDIFDEYIHKNIVSIEKKRSIDLKEVFPNNPKQMGIYLQLYLVKLTGFMLNDELLDRNLTDSLAKSLREMTPRKDLLIEFSYRDHEDKLTISKLYAKTSDDIVFNAEWTYSFGSISITVFYYSLASLIPRIGPIKWSPFQKSKIIRLTNTKNSTRTRQIDI